MSKILKRNRWLKIALFALALVFSTSSGYAAKDYYLYDKQGNEEYNAITSESYFVAMCYLPDSAGASLKGRLLGATGTSIYLQDAVDSPSWTKVGQTTGTMDASFIKVSPGGNKIALGMGYGQPLLVFNRSVITSGTTPPPNVETDSNTKNFPTSRVKYYDATWVDNTYLLIIGGRWDDVNQTVHESGISTLDTSNAANNLNTILYDDTAIAASSGIAIDANKNIIYGNGYTYNSSQSLTGELRMLPMSVWWDDTNDVPKTFEPPEYPNYVAGGYLIASSRKFANSVLSAAHLGFDQEGNLHVGGGQYWGAPDPNTENGYAALINKKVITDTASGTNLYQIDETDATQYREIAADSCRNDTATGVLSYKRSLTLNWLNQVSCTSPPQDDTTNGYGSCSESWTTNQTSKLTTYRISTTHNADSDTDANGNAIPDVDDHSPWTADATNTDTDGDGFGNIIDADFNNDWVVDNADQIILTNMDGTSDAECDMNSSGTVDNADQLLFNGRDGKKAPFYAPYITTP